MMFDSLKRMKVFRTISTRQSFNVKKFSNVVFLEKYNLHYNLDEVIIENGVLHLRGWLFSECFLIQKMGIFVGNTTGIYEFPIPWGKKRLDVYAALGQENAQSSGWDIAMEYTTDTSIRGYIYCVIDNKIVPLEIRDFVVSEQNDKKNHFKELINDDLRYVAVDTCVIDKVSEDATKQVKKILRENTYSVYFNHELGGGASKYLSRVMEKEKQALLVSYEMYSRKYRLSVMRCGKEILSCQFNEWKKLLKILKLAMIERINVNELVTFPDVYVVLQDIVEKLQRKETELRFLLHDYFCICPQFNLMGEQGYFCGIPEEEKCDTCLEDKKENIKIDEWRRNWKKFLHCCDEIRCFSYASKDLLEKVYGDALKISLVPHSMEYFERLVQEKRIRHHVHETGENLHVGILGVLTEAKGLNIVEAMLEKIETENLPIDITLIGSASKNIDSSRFCQTGRYDMKSLPDIAEARKIDIFLIPSVWPETFSYTTGEVMAMGYPIMVFDMGAPAERVREYKRGYVVKEVSAEAVCKMLLDNVIR